MDETTISTLSFLEARLLRIEHLLYGPTVPRTTSDQEESAFEALAHLESRLSRLLKDFRVYSDLLKIYQAHPTLFLPDPTPPAQSLPTQAVQATVLASASQFPATASSLTAVFDTPVPEPELSASLASLGPRMRGIEAVQAAQTAEVAALRSRSEAILRRWYEHGVVGNSELVSRVERRVARLEKGVRRRERETESDNI